jgi:flagella basal body P-ring formation protein FlgA
MRKIFIYALLMSVLSLSAWAIEASDKAHLFTVSYAEAEAAVGNALADKGAAEKVAAMINGRKNQPLFSYSKPMRVEPRGLQFDHGSNHWSANLLIVSEGEVITAFPAAGRFDKLVEIPVLKRAVRNGQIIEAEDIEIRDIPVLQTRGDTVTDIGSLIGKSPSHSISPSRPIRVHEIAQPAMIKRNSVVQMHYRSGSMEIITSGQAMEDGAKGEFINVKNLASKKIVQAMVADNGHVSVNPPESARVQAESNPTLKDLYATN